MPANKAKVYIVSIKGEDGRKLYFCRSQSRFIKDGDMVLNEPIGIFSPDLKDAKKYLDKFRAEWTASYFDGAGVECIKSGERLK